MTLTSSISAGIKHQAEYALSRLYTTGTGESPFEDDVPELRVSHAHYGHSEINRDNFDQFDIIWINETDKVRSRIPKVLQVANGTDSENLLTTTDFVIAQATDQYCKDIAKDMGKLHPSIPTTRMKF